ncbi:MAG TPA: hypothetical protein DCR59_01195 [Dehalococcoidia bacterium]|nr:hypothetical protein [Dehalococcoidia bacterium]
MPTKPSLPQKSTLKDLQTRSLKRKSKTLHKAIQDVLRLGIRNKGASVTNYFRPDGETGSAHKQFKVAHCKDKPCPVCNTPLERIRVHQRGTYFCPHCQK